MIATDYFWNNVLLLAFGTIAIRISFIALSSKIKISERHKEIFSFIPASILPALIAPMVYFHKGQVDWLLQKERVIVLTIATVVCYLTRSTVVTVLFGMMALYFVTNF